MNPVSRRFLAVASIFFAVMAAHASTVLVNAVVDVTPEGEKSVEPSPSNPVHYFPMIVGYFEQGSWPAEALPSSYQVLHTVAQALASRGYLVKTRTSPATVLLTFRWGRLAPRSDFTRMDGIDDDMASLVGGLNKGFEINDPSEARKTEFLVDASLPRYFLVIEAYDYAAAAQKNKIPLWCARVSLDAEGQTLRSALRPLVAVAAPLLGHDVRPHAIAAP
jgi:hypothetical protein